MAEIIDFPAAAKKPDKLMDRQSRQSRRQYDREIQRQRDAEQMADLDEELKINPNLKLSPADAYLAAEQLFTLMEKVRRENDNLSKTDIVNRARSKMPKWRTEGRDSSDASKKSYDYLLNPALSPEKKKVRRRRIVRKVLGFFRLAEAAGELGRMNHYHGCVEVFRGTVHLSPQSPDADAPVTRSSVPDHVLHMDDLLRKMGSMVIAKHRLIDYFKWLSESIRYCDSSTGRLSIDGDECCEGAGEEITEGYPEPRQECLHVVSTPLSRTGTSTLMPGTLVLGAMEPYGNYYHLDVPAVRNQLTRDNELVPVDIQSFREMHLVIELIRPDELGLAFQVRDLIVPFHKGEERCIELEGTYHEPLGVERQISWSGSRKSARLFLNNLDDVHPLDYEGANEPYFYHYFTVNPHNCGRLLSTPNIYFDSAMGQSPWEYLPGFSNTYPLFPTARDPQSHTLWPQWELGAYIERNLLYAPHDQKISARLEQAAKVRLGEMEQYKNVLLERVLTAKGKLFKEWEKDNDK